MPKILTEGQIEQYRRENFLAPLEALTPEETQHYRACLERYEDEQGGARLAPWQYRKVHVREPWAAELVRIPRVLDAVEDLIGPDILIFNATFFIKEPGENQITAWHQDSTYFGMQPYEHVTAWIALSDASEKAGCMEFVVGSSGFGQLYHAPQTVVGSVNHGSQAIAEPFDDSHIASAPLKAGQFSFHHTLVVHSSAPNRSQDRRIGYGISYIPAHVHHVGSYRMGASHARGEDKYGHFEIEPDPREHGAAEGPAHHEAAYRRYREGYEEQVAAHKAAYGNREGRA
jgi:non-heme Fe2+,alpha-ketoglutarate-dependent halogenase